MAKLVTVGRSVLLFRASYLRRPRVLRNLELESCVAIYSLKMRSTLFRELELIADYASHIIHPLAGAEIHDRSVSRLHGYIYPRDDYRPEARKLQVFFPRFFGSDDLMFQFTRHFTRVTKHFRTWNCGERLGG
jgi:hypothetical protein